MQIQIVKHKGHRYLFAWFQHEITLDNKHVQTALEQLPEKLPSQHIRVKTCPEFKCYSMTTTPSLTFYQKYKQVGEYHPCTTKENKNCKDKKEQVLEFSPEWTPREARQDLDLKGNPSKWVAFLIDLKSHSVAGIAEGTLSELETLEIHPSFRNQGLCALLLWLVFRTLRQHKMISFAIHNAAGKHGESCYRKAGKLAGLTFFCNKQHLNDETYCSQMQFELA